MLHRPAEHEKLFKKHLLTDLVKGSSSNLVSVEYYDKKTLPNILKKHLSEPRKFSLTKFNFIITPYISDYLDWVAHVKKSSRSDFLRDAVTKKIIETDHEYQKYLFSKRHKL